MASVWTRDLRVCVCCLADEEQREQSQPQQFLHFHCWDTIKEKQMEMFYSQREAPKHVVTFVSEIQLTSVPQRSPFADVGLRDN